MKQQENKRRISAWILIAVFVPMLLLSFTHTHSVGSGQSVECQECLHHVHHTHLGTADSCIDNCVLCQMLSVVYYPAVALVLCVLFLILKNEERRLATSPCTGFNLLHSGRAPPQSVF